MSGGVLLARVSLNEKLLAVTDHRGVIVLVSEDACWALGVPGPAASFVGSSLLDHLTPEDQIEYRVRRVLWIGCDGWGWECVRGPESAGVRMPQADGTRRGVGVLDSLAE